MCKQQNLTGGTFRSLLKVVHDDEEGAVSVETVLILAAIALPVLIFLIKVAWPRMRDWYLDKEGELFEGSDAGI